MHLSLSCLHVCHALPYLFDLETGFENDTCGLGTCCVPQSAPYLTIVRRSSFCLKKEKKIQKSGDDTSDVEARIYDDMKISSMLSLFRCVEKLDKLKCH